MRTIGYIVVGLNPSGRVVSSTALITKEQAQIQILRSDSRLNFQIANVVLR